MSSGMFNSMSKKSNLLPLPSRRQKEEIYLKHLITITAMGSCNIYYVRTVSIFQNTIKMKNLMKQMNVTQQFLFVVDMGYPTVKTEEPRLGALNSVFFDAHM